MSAPGLTPNCFLELFRAFHTIAEDRSLQVQLIEELEESKEPELILQLRSLIAALTIEEFGLTGKFLDTFVDHDIISDTTIYDTDSLSLHLFGLPRSQGFPLHNHPEMIGFSVVLYGQVRYRNLSIVSTEGGRVLAKQVIASSLDAPGCLILTPAHGNIHEVYATQNSVILDIFVPNYSSSRCCSFYKQLSQVGDTATLRLIMPPALRARPVAYRGPRITI